MPVRCLMKQLIASTFVSLACLTAPAIADEPINMTLSDAASIGSDMAHSLEGEARRRPRSHNNHGQRHYLRTPAMIGDYFAGRPISFGGNATLDRLFVLADDLDAPLVLPGAGATLTITEPGPIGVFDANALSNIQQLQTLLRAGSPLPATPLAGIVGDNATLTTTLTISQIQNLLASTGAGSDIITVAAPPGAYGTAVQAFFLTRNSLPGTTTYNAAGSGAVLQGGTDTLAGGEDFDAYYFYDYVVRFNTALADATSGGVGSMKIAEGGTVLPQNRVFFRYNYLSGVNYSNSRNNLNRMVPGFERAFLDGLFSVELRAPFATDTSTSATLDRTTFSNGTHTRFGNLTVYLKALLLESEDFAISGGLGIATPTAEDITVDYSNGAPLLQVSNQSVRLQPFLAGLYTPSRDLFLQSFLQFDTAANGNPVAINSTGTGLTDAGTLTDGSHLFADVGLGYWLYRSDDSRGLTGIIPTVELHQNMALQNGDLISAGPFQVANTMGATSWTNIVAGSTFQFGRATSLSTAYTGPLGGGMDRQFNGGFQAFVSHGW